MPKFNPVVYQDKVIDQILNHDDSFVITRLFDQYIGSADKDSFVMALIGRMLLMNKRFDGKPLF